MGTPNSRSGLVCPVAFLSYITSEASFAHKTQHTFYYWADKEHLALS